MTNAQPQHRWPDDVGTERPIAAVDAAELKTMRDMGRAITLVDTRPQADFEREHLPGALNVPLGADFTGRAGRWIPKRGTVVVYGDTPGVVSERLAAAGWPVVRYFAGAVGEWRKLGAMLGPFETHRPVISSGHGG